MYIIWNQMHICRCTFAEVEIQLYRWASFFWANNIFQIEQKFSWKRVSFRTKTMVKRNWSFRKMKKKFRFLKKKDNKLNKLSFFFTKITIFPTKFWKKNEQWCFEKHWFISLKTQFKLKKFRSLKHWLIPSVRMMMILMWIWWLTGISKSPI